MVTLIRRDLIITLHFLCFFFLIKVTMIKKQQQPCRCFILQCSVSCGRGHKQRNVYCLAKDGSHLESDYCKHLTKPHGHRRCRGGRCPRWKAGAWSQVSTVSLPKRSLLFHPMPDPSTVSHLCFSALCSFYKLAGLFTWAGWVALDKRLRSPELWLVPKWRSCEVES